MSWAEVELRFLDCLKLLQRRQQMESMTLLSSIGSLLVKKGEKNFFEVCNDTISSINQLIGESAAPEPEEEKTDAELRREEAKRIAKMYEDMEFVVNAINEGRATTQEF